MEGDASETGEAEDAVAIKENEFGARAVGFGIGRRVVVTRLLGGVFKVFKGKRGLQVAADVGLG